LGILRSQLLAKSKHKNQVDNLLPTLHEVSSLDVLMMHQTSIKHLRSTVLTSTFKI